MISHSKPRKFRGFVALLHVDGPIVWGTFRRYEAEARQAYERFNPSVEGFPDAVHIVQAEIKIIDYRSR